MKIDSWKIHSIGFLNKFREIQRLGLAVEDGSGREVFKVIRYSIKDNEGF